MSYTTLSTIILIVAAMLVCAKAISGYKAGATRSIADLALLIFSVSLSSVISVLSASVAGDPLYESVRYTVFYQNIVMEIGDVQSLALILTGIIGAVILFVPIFLLVYGIGSLILHLIFKACVVNLSDRGDEQEGAKVSFYTKNGKAIGSVVGAVSGFVILVVLLTPVVGILKNTTELVDTLESVLDTEIVEDYGSDSIFSYSDDVMASVIYASGGQTIFDTLTTVHHGGRTTTLRKEIEVMAELKVDEISEVIDDIIEGNSDDAEKTFEKSRKSLLVEALMHVSVTNAANSWISGESYLGVDRPVLGEGEKFDDFLDEVLYVCARSSIDTFSDDMITLINVTGMFSERKGDFMSGSYESMMSVFEDEDFLDELREELEKNSNMQHVLYAIDDLLLTIIAEEVLDVGYSEYARESFYRSIADSMNATQHLSGKERVDELATSILDAFGKYGAYLPEALGDDIAQILIDRIDSYGTVRTSDVARLFSGYMQ